MPKKYEIYVGDRVVTDFINGDGAVVRTVTEVISRAVATSRVVISADGGCVCQTCNRPPSKPIKRIDSSWFKVVRPKD